MAQQFRYQHYRSIVPDVEPSVSEIREGEIAVNLYAGKEKMFLKNTNNQIVRFVTEAQVDAKIATGSSAPVEAKIQALSGAIDTNTSNIGTLQISASTLNIEKFGDVRYVSGSNRINFYSSSNSQTVLAWIDTSDFIKDGMVDNVEVKTIGDKSYLVITFNTDSGKQPIEIAIEDIYDASNYYTKTEIDDKLTLKADKTELTNEVNRATTTENNINERIDNLTIDCGKY